MKSKRANARAFTGLSVVERACQIQPDFEGLCFGLSKMQLPAVYQCDLSHSRCHWLPKSFRHINVSTKSISKPQNNAKHTIKNISKCKPQLHPRNTALSCLSSQQFQLVVDLWQCHGKMTQLPGVTWP